MTGLAKKLFYLVADPLTGDSDLERLKKAVKRERELAEMKALEIELKALRANRER